MNFIILIFIFRKYLHISKILLLHYLLSEIFENFHPLTSGRPKLPARCPLYNTCMITRLRPSMIPLLYPPGNTLFKSPWPEDSRGFSEGLLSGYRISVYYIPIT
jgi:hypothetical protein